VAGADAPSERVDGRRPLGKLLTHVFWPQGQLSGRAGLGREIRVGRDALCAGLASVRSELLAVRAIDGEGRLHTCSVTLTQSHAFVPAVGRCRDDLHRVDLHAIRI
jgi:hypothetical protein